MPESKGESMRVIVRVRPENSRECKSSADSTEVPLISAVDEQVLVFDPKIENAPTYFHGQKVKFRDMTKRKAKDFKCVFDSVLTQFSTQQEVFEASSLDVVKSVVDGYNGSVFAYGATGAGKTHTMLGSVDQPGVIYQTMVELFRLMEEREDTVFELGVSYMEIYNETIRDLFGPSGASRPLPLREDEKGAVSIAGLTFHSPKSVRELYDMLLTGNQNRTQHPTDANSQSSRSHAIFQVYLRQRPVNSGTTTRFSLSKLSLIDLAGSERAAATTNRANRMREGANINRSLLALGNCINALAENKKNMHIPWRNSQLTRILKDCLGTNCKTCMIAAVSPSRLTFEDTFNTLKYALRAKSIKSQLKKETINVTEHVGKYQSIIETLKTENERLNSQINSLREELKAAEEKINAAIDQAFSAGDKNSEAKRERRLSSVATANSHRGSRSIVSAEAQRTVKKLKSVHTQRAQLRKSMLQIESEEKQHRLSLHFVDQMKKLVQVFSSESDEQERRTLSLQAEEEDFKQKMDNLHVKKQTLIEKMAKVEEDYSRLWGEVATWEVSDEAEFLTKELHILEQMIKINDLHHQNSHLRSLTERQQEHITDQSSKLFPIAQFLKSLLMEVEFSDCLPSTQQWLHNFTNLQRSVMDNLPHIEMTSNFTVSKQRDSNVNRRSQSSQHELQGEKFEQILDFTILKPISPKTPGLPRNPSCHTPFTGDKIMSHNTKKSTVVGGGGGGGGMKRTPIQPLGGNINGTNDKTLTGTGTATKKRKSATPTPRSAKVKQFAWSKSQNVKSSAAKQTKFMVSGNQQQKGDKESNERKASGSGSVASRAVAGLFNKTKSKPTNQTATSAKTTVVQPNESNLRKRKPEIVTSSKQSSLSDRSTSSTTRSATAMSAVSTTAQPVARQFKKSISSSVMPNTNRLSIMPNNVSGSTLNSSKSSRSWSRRRSKTPSPVRRKLHHNFKPIPRRDTFVKRDLENIFETQRALAISENEGNRRCTVAAPSSIATRSSTTVARLSRDTTKSSSRASSAKHGLDPSSGPGANAKRNSRLITSAKNESNSFESSKPEFTIFGASTLDRLVDENTDPLGFSRLREISDPVLNFDNENDNTVNDVRRAKIAKAGLSNCSTPNENPPTFSFSTPDGKNDTFVRRRESNDGSGFLQDTVFDSGSKFVQSLGIGQTDDSLLRRSTLNSFYSNNKEETVANAMAKYRRATLLQNRQMDNK